MFWKKNPKSIRHFSHGFETLNFHFAYSVLFSSFVA